MNTKFKAVIDSLSPDLLQFAQDLVRIKSYTGSERDVILRVKREMERLHYDQVLVDQVGSVVGIIGNGPTKVYFDGHTDTVLADPREWSFDPWSGDIQDGFLRGRGSVDMKSSAAAAVYGAYAARELGYTAGKTIYVSCSVMEEDYEGAAVDNEFRELNFLPDYAVICEPTRLRICNGHFGRALFEVAVKGVGIHASRHQLGDNALNKIVPIIQRVESLGKELLASGGERGSIASTKLVTESVSINSTPGLATLTIDRRTTPEDTQERLSEEIDRLCADIPDASWSVVDTYGTSWTSREMVLHNLMPAWKIPEDHHLVRSAWDACTDLGLEPVVYRRSGFTNGWVTCGRYQIPTIVFGAGDEACCHIVDEACPTDQILSACAFYTRLEAAL